MKVVEATALGKKFGDLSALIDISFSLFSGQSLYINGRNGAGKTTFLEIICGFLKESSGRLLILEDSPSKKIITGVFEDSFLYPDMSVEENLEFFASLYEVEDSKSRINDMIARFELKDKRDSSVKQLSLGMEKKVSLARAFLPDPSLLILDEPFSGLDYGSKAEAITLIKGIQKDGCSVVFTSHDSSMAGDIATHVLVLKDGRQEFFGDAEEGLKRIK